jgi:hypothetical protein
MKTIPLTQGQIALVDDEDFERVNQFEWYAIWNKNSKTFYARRNSSIKNNSKSQTIWMHRFILGLKKGDERQVDHGNHKGWDNRRENIKIKSRRQNAENLKKQSIHGVGIFYNKKCKNKPYRLQIKINGKTEHIGYFKTPEDAQIAREKYKKDNNL